MESRTETKLQLIGVCLALVVLTGWTYWPVRLNEFINYDDQQYITENPHVQAGLTWEGTKWAFTTGHASNWHPLTWVSHMADVECFGLRPSGHHLVNLGFHMANSVLVFLLLVQMTGAFRPSALVAFLFALHPLHVESVAWASERKDVLSTFFGLLSLLAYSRYAARFQPRPVAAGEPEPGTRLGFPAAGYSLALLFFALGLLCKPMLVTLPLVMVLLDLWPLKRWRNRSANPRLFLEKLPFFALALGSCVVTTLVQQKAMLHYKYLPFTYRVANAFVSYERYVGKAIWPRDLSILYPHPGGWPVRHVVLAVGAFLVLFVLALLAGRRKPYLTVGWFWFLGTLVPVIGLVQVGIQAMADRYAYLPSVGLFIMLAWAMAEWAEPSKVRLLCGLATSGVLIGACALGARAQVRYWRDTETVFTHALAVTSGNWVAHHNLALLALSRYQQTQRSSIEAQVLEPSGPPGGTLNRDYLAEVVDHCEAALQTKPRLAEVHVTLAKALTEQGKLDQALAHLQGAVRADPTNAPARQNLAEILHRQGRAREAAAEYRATLQLEPDWEAVINNLAWLLATCPDPAVRDGREAVRLAEHACALTGRTNLWYLHTLGAAYAEAGDFAQAASTAEAALRLATPLGQPDILKKAQDRLDLYKHGRPLRDP